jgi:hypothetical protein
MQNLELCSIVSAHFLVVNGAKMFTRLVIMTMMAVLCSSAMAEMPEVSFYLRGTEEKDLMQDFWDEDAAFWAREMDVDDSMSLGRRLETGFSMSL